MHTLIIDDNSTPVKFSPLKTNHGSSSRAHTPIIDEEFSSQRINHRDSLMQIDLDYYDYYDDCKACDNCDDREDCDKRKKLVPLPRSHNTENERYLMFKEFNYTMNIFDEKITSLYKLCRYISDQ